MDDQTQYRVGSPFAEPPADPRDDGRNPASGGSVPASDAIGTTAGDRLSSDPLQAEELGPGVWEQTATSAVLASCLLTIFAGLCWRYFPAGGLAVAGLGVAVSVLGLSSNRRRLATALLATHAVVFIGCYLRIIP